MLFWFHAHILSEMICGALLLQLFSCFWGVGVGLVVDLVGDYCGKDRQASGQDKQAESKCLKHLFTFKG